jgi:predicted alpha/beta-hydrolase family hydrolase
MSVPSIRRVRVAGAGEVTTLHYAATDGAGRGLLVLAHGAGADQRHRVMTRLADGIAARGVDVVTFNFLYTDERRRTPDRAPVLEQTWTAVVEAIASDLPARTRLVVGGKSMGGRIASQVLAKPPASPAWTRVSGLVLLGYPLHPPGQPDRLRTAHLPAVRVPILLVHGTRDAFGTREEVEPVFLSLPVRVDVAFIERGDHGFAVPKSTGLTEAAVLDGICERVAAWILG